MRDFKKLIVWEKAHQLTLAVYNTTKEFPDTERYGLISQMRRSSASVPTNIAEGCGRGSEAEFAHFLQIAAGSSSELEYQLLLAYDLNFLSSTLYDSLNHDVNEIKKMLNALIKKLKANR